MELRIRTFADVMNGQAYAEIFNRQGQLVRKLSFAAGRVQIDALEPPVVSVDINDPIFYEPWFMDVGSFLFCHEELPNGRGKLCCEWDVIKFPNGNFFSIVPASGCERVNKTYDTTETKDGTLFTGKVEL